MIEFHYDAFLRKYLKVFGNITSSQEEGLNFLAIKFMQSERFNSIPKIAYGFATIAHECGATWQPIEEWGSEVYLRSKPYYPYYGRGFCQLTWLRNYEIFGKALKLNLVAHPELALEPENAWRIFEMGMTDPINVKDDDPDFTAHTLEDYFDNGKCDYYNARKIVNPGDRKTFQPIAEKARKFYNLISSSIIAKEDIPEWIK